VPETQQPDAPKRPLLDKLGALLERAQKGDSEAMAKAREILAREPELWEQVGDLAAHAQGAWIDLLACGNPILEEAYCKKLAAMRAELSGPCPSPLEALLIDRIVTSWLQASHADAHAAQSREVPIGHAKFLAQRLAQADRRFRRAVAELFTMRRLLRANAASTDVRANKVSRPSLGPMPHPPVNTENITNRSMSDAPELAGATKPSEEPPIIRLFERGADQAKEEAYRPIPDEPGLTQSSTA